MKNILKQMKVSIFSDSPVPYEDFYAFELRFIKFIEEDFNMKLGKNISLHAFNIESIKLIVS